MKGSQMKGTHRSGQVLPLIAISLAALLGFAGIAVDVGYLEYWQQEQQSATDAAAMGGAQYLASSNCANGALAQAAAQTDANGNGFTNGANNVTVTPHSPPLTGPYANNACAISVQITTNHVATFFSQLFGYPQGMSESTSATATISSNGGGACIYLLSSSSWSSFNGATVNSPGCAIAINYSADFDGGTIAAPAIGYVSPAPNYGGTTFTMASPAPMLPVADPCPKIPGCAGLAASPPPTTNCSGYNSNGGNATIQPGCYSYLNLDPPGTITMAPGTYVINGSFNDNGVTLVGSGVTIYVTANGNGPNFDNGAPVTLSPPTSGNYSGVLYYQVPSNTSGINFNGPNVNMSGLIYAPGSTSANFNSNSGSYAVLVFGSMNFNNNSAYDFASPPPGQSLVKTAVLAE
jgi:hypothetical protein